MSKKKSKPKQQLQVLLTPERTAVCGYVTELSPNSFRWTLHEPVDIPLYKAGYEIDENYRRTLTRIDSGKGSSSNAAFASAHARFLKWRADKKREEALAKSKEEGTATVNEKGQTVHHLVAQNLDLPNPTTPAL